LLDSVRLVQPAPVEHNNVPQVVVDDGHSVSVVLKRGPSASQVARRLTQLPSKQRPPVEVMPSLHAVP
jgi:hypothetical protein